MPVYDKKILLADDDPEDREMLIDAFQGINAGVPIDAVSNGREALDYLFNCPVNELPALVILDYKMPLLNAAEVLEAMKEKKEFAPITKFVWSTSRQTELMDRCRSAGATQYFVKPSSFRELKDIARKILQMI